MANHKIKEMKLKKCLLEIELYFNDDNTVNMNSGLNDDRLNDIGKHFKESQIKHIGDLAD